jgi:hypothetical protein
LPYKDPEKQRQAQREYVARKRAEFFAGKCCVDCGSTEELQLDHRDKSEKTSHKIWSWSTERRLAEIAMCDVRCGPCHRERHAAERRSHGIGGYKRGCRCFVCKEANRQKSRRGYARRRRRELNSGTGLCRPVHSHSATPPTDETGQGYLFEDAA